MMSNHRRVDPNTRSLLQRHLAKKDKLYPGTVVESPGHNVASVVCVDGTRLSVQASSRHFSRPKRDNGPYSKVEVMLEEKSVPMGWQEYGDGSDPFGYVPLQDVVDYIDEHGGIAGFSHEEW